MKTKDWIYFWALSLIWGTSFFWISIAVNEISPTMVVAFRTLFGAIGLGLLIYLNKNVKLEWKKIKPHIFDFLLLGFFNITLPFMLISFAQKHIDSGVTSILNGANPIFTVILAPIFIKDERITPLKILGLLLGFFGVITLMSPSIQGGWNANLMGQLMVLLATFCYAIGSIYARRRLSGFPAEVPAFLQLSASALYTWIIMLFTERPLIFPTQPITWIALAWLGFLGASVAYFIYFYLLQRIGPSRISMITYIMPLFGIFLGMAFLGEPFFWQVLAGMVLILSGTALVNRQKKTPVISEN